MLKQIMKCIFFNTRVIKKNNKQKSTKSGWKIKQPAKLEIDSLIENKYTEI